MGRIFSFFNINNRLYYHLLFWLCYFTYRVMLYGDIKNTYENVAYVQAMELILKIPLAYFILYFLKPRFFDHKKYFVFGLLAALSVAVVSYLQLHIIWFCVQLGIYNNTTYEIVFSMRKFRSSMGHINWVLILTFVIKLAKERYENAQINSQLLKDKLEAELQFLKSQINPHFFFNTLNNLYALTIKKSDQAPEVVLKLSGLMSYLIYETRNDTVKFEKELSFIKNYVELEKLRYGQYLNVELNVSNSMYNLQIAPLLFIPFIENAFKHGVSIDDQINTVKISFSSTETSLFFSVKNTISSQNQNNESGGVGLPNVKRRLELLFPQRHNLRIANNGRIYEVELTIDLIAQVK